MNRRALRELEERIGYQFRAEELLTTALTHPSYGGDHKAPSYQRLEFLGDAVVELSASRMLYEGYPDLGEGRLTRLRAELVREESLSEIARGFAMGPLIRLSAGEEKSGGADKPSILCDVMEAVVAAVYLDGGFDEAFHLVERMLRDRMPRDEKPDALDAKSRLQELLQREGGPAPEYELIAQGGPAHEPVFEMCVRLDGKAVGRGQAHSKRAAQQQAAHEALRRLTEEGRLNP